MGATFVWSREALLDYAATQVGVNQTAFGTLGGFAQRFIANALAPGEAREQDVLVEGSFGLRLSFQLIITQGFIVRCFVQQREVGFGAATAFHDVLFGAVKGEK